MKRRSVLIPSIFLSIIVLSFLLTPNLKAATYANPQYLMETETLAKQLGKKGLIAVDTRAPELYREGHIKGAINLPKRLLTGMVGGVKDMILPVKELEKVIGSRGISPQNHLVFYEERTGNLATQHFWIFDTLGHKKISILNGGITKWAREKRPIDTVEKKLPPVTYKAKYDVSRVATLEEVNNSLGKKDVVLVDCRTEDEYKGRVPSREVTRAGRIPKAICINWVNNITTKDGFKVLKSADELLSLYEKAGVTRNKEVITYCKDSSRSSNTYFVLRLLGYPKVSNYDGSMMEWGNIRDLPIEKE